MMHRLGCTLLCISAHVASILSDNPSKVAYFSFVSSIQNVTESSSSITVYNELLQVDDSPFEQVDLPWKFNLLGSNINRLFISPNGGLHASSVQPCPPKNHFDTDEYGLYNSYYSVIGALLTDLNPQASPNGNITSYTRSDHLTVEYHNIVYFGTGVSNSFRIRVFKDSHIEIAYDKISKVPSLNVPRNQMWSSGLRSFKDNEYAYFTPAQRSFAQTEWVYSRASNDTGVYPSQADVATGNQFNICPVSRVWCVSPAVVSRNATVKENPSPYITFTTSLLSCVDIVQYGAVFTSTANIVYSIPCDAVRNVSLQCNISGIVASALPAGEYSVSPAWRVSNTSAYALLPVDNIHMTIVDASLYNATTQNYTQFCANNQYNTSCAGGSCALCSGDYSCLNHTCSADTVASDDEVQVGLTNSLYDQPTCADTCPVFTTNTSEAYYPDFGSECCTLAQTDCSGRCNGTSQLAHNVDNALVCCSLAVDCMGLCGGNNVTDCAGVCRGTSFIDNCGDCSDGNDKCYETSQISVKSITGQAALYPVYDITSGPGGYHSVLQLNITNESTFEIRVVITEPESSTRRISPILTIPGALTMPPQSYTIVNIGSNIAPLLNNANTTWANKYIEVQYQRAVKADPQGSVQMYVYPRVSGCDTNSARLSCLRLPGCIFCYDSTLMRLLRQDTPDEVPLDDNYSYTSAARKLFIELVPWSLGDPGDSLTGICTDGWLNEDCAAAAPYAFVNAAGSMVDSVWVLSAILAVFSVSFLL